MSAFRIATYNFMAGGSARRSALHGVIQYTLYHTGQIMMIVASRRA